MQPLHYLIFHPESRRERVETSGRALRNGVPQKWQGAIWVDELIDNEDPYVFSIPWLFSFCHASQLKRKPSKEGFVQHGSYLFFCSGDAADVDELKVDTVFLVDQVARWPKDQHDVPDEFQKHFENENSNLWMRHLQFGLIGHHKGTYTYLSRPWSDGAAEFSFLPIDHRGERVTISFDQLRSDLRHLLEKKRRGRYPAKLTETQKSEVLDLLVSNSAAQIIEVRNPERSQRGGTRDRGCGGC